MKTYIASAGDTVDYIVWKAYGTQGGRLVERVLEANPGLADKGAILPSGTAVTLPDLDTATETASVRLWD